MRDALDDRVLGDHVDAIVGEPVRVRDELPADDEVVVRAVAERVRDAAVPAGQPGAVADRRVQALDVLGGDLAHGYALQDQVDTIQVEVALGRAGDGDLVAVLLQVRDVQVGRLDRGMTFPAAPDHQWTSCRQDIHPSKVFGTETERLRTTPVTLGASRPAFKSDSATWIGHGW